MKQFWDKTFGKFHSVIIENGLEWVYVVFAILFLLGGLLTWLLTSLKARRELYKLKNENEKLIAEVGKINTEKSKLESEIKKINTETEKLDLDKRKTIQETRHLAIEQKEKLINITKEVAELNENYNSNLELFLTNLQEIYSRSTQNKLEKHEIDRLVEMFYVKIINPFTNYFSMWKALYESDTEETEDFINVRLKPYLNLSSSLLNKIIDLGGELNGSMVSSDVFKPVIEFGKRTNHHGIIDKQVDELCSIFDCNF